MNQFIWLLNSISGLTPQQSLQFNFKIPLTVIHGTDLIQSNNYGSIIRSRGEPMLKLAELFEIQAKQDNTPSCCKIVLNADGSTERSLHCNQELKQFMRQEKWPEIIQKFTWNPIRDYYVVKCVVHSDTMVFTKVLNIVPRDLCSPQSALTTEIQNQFKTLGRSKAVKVHKKMSEFVKLKVPLQIMYLTFESGHNLAIEENDVDGMQQEQIRDAIRLIHAQLSKNNVTLTAGTFYFQFNDGKMTFIYSEALTVLERKITPTAGITKSNLTTFRQIFEAHYILKSNQSAEQHSQQCTCLTFMDLRPKVQDVLQWVTNQMNKSIDLKILSFFEYLLNVQQYVIKQSNSESKLTVAKCYFCNIRDPIPNFKLQLAPLLTLKNQSFAPSIDDRQIPRIVKSIVPQKLSLQNLIEPVAQKKELCCSVCLYKIEAQIQAEQIHDKEVQLSRKSFQEDFLKIMSRKKAQLQMRRSPSLRIQTNTQITPFGKFQRVDAQDLEPPTPVNHVSASKVPQPVEENKVKVITIGSHIQKRQPPIWIQNRDSKVGKRNMELYLNQANIRKAEKKSVQQLQTLEQISTDLQSSIFPQQSQTFYKSRSLSNLPFRQTLNKFKKQMSKTQSVIGRPKLSEGLAEQEIQVLMSDRVTSTVNRLKIINAHQSQKKLSRTVTMPTKLDKISRSQLRDLRQCEALVHKMEEALYSGNQTNLIPYRNFVLTTGAYKNIDLIQQEFDKKQSALTHRCQSDLKIIQSNIRQISKFR